MLKRLAIVPLLGALALFAAPVAGADSYTDVVVAPLSATNHVVVDNNADPKLPNPNAINDQINQTHAPIWVVNVAKDQTGSATPQAIKDALYGTHNPVTAPIQVNGQSHNPPLIILTIDGKGYHAQSFDVSQQVADETGPNVKHAAAAHHGDLNGAVSAFVSEMAAVPNTGPPVSASEPATPQHHDMTWAWVMLWVLVAGLGVGALAYGLMQMKYARDRRRVEQDRIRDDINTTEAHVNDLAEAVLQGVDVSSYQTKASLALSSAQTARDKGDWGEAASQQHIAQRYVDEAYDKATPDRAKVRATPKKERKAAMITATDATGSPVTVTNHDYSRQRRSGYRNYYAGGERDGVYFYPGWYPYPFWLYSWQPTDITLGDNLVTDHWQGSYNSPDNTSEWITSSLASSVPFSPPSYSGSDSSSDTSASFTEPEPEHHHSHHSSSSSSSSDSSSSYSGGYSSPASSFDFGGGGGGFSGDSSGGGSAGF